MYKICEIAADRQWAFVPFVDPKHKRYAKRLRNDDASPRRLPDASQSKSFLERGDTGKWKLGSNPFLGVRKNKPKSICIQFWGGSKKYTFYNCLQKR